jgi:hypothetical protein
MIHRISEKEAIALARGDYGEAFAKAAAQQVAPLFFAGRRPDGTWIVRNGTAFLINSGTRVFGVTAAHVVIEAGKLASQTDSFTCGLFPVNYSTRAKELIELGDMSKRIIGWRAPRDPNDSNPDSGPFDIATFEVAEVELQALGVTAFGHWPPKPPTKGFGLSFFGFPEEQREREEEPRVVSFAVLPIVGVASSVTEDRITFQFDPEYAVQTQGFKQMPMDAVFSGMSGGPAVAKFQTQQGLEYSVVCGTITNGAMMPDSSTGLLFASRLDVSLRADGTFA